MARLFPRSADRIRREAADWRARLANDRSPQTAAAFGRWREADVRNAEAFERLNRIWAASTGLVGASGSAERIGTLPRTSRHGLALAASLLLVVALPFLFAVQQGWWDPFARAPKLLVMTTPTGALGKNDLPDGSRVILDASSRLEARFSGSRRLVSLLEGRARFEVANDSRPFIVRAGSSEIATSGTLFDVSVYEGQATVLLIKGSVLVRDSVSSGVTSRLKAGEKLVAGAVQPRKVAPAELAWPSGMIGFEGTSLGEAAATMNRYSKVQLRLGNSRIAGLQVTGAWRAGDVEGFARSLERAFDLALERGPDGSIMLRSNGRHPPV